MKCSVVLASYNGERYIYKQLQSVLCQTRAADEVIISDDGSTDHTLQIVLNFIQENGLEGKWFLRQNQNHGVRENFRGAVAVSTGDILFLCDQDDIWMPEKLQTICDFFLREPSALCVNTSFTYINRDNEEIKKDFPAKTSNHGLILHQIPDGDAERIPLKLVINKNISPGMTMAFKRSLAELWIQNTQGKNWHDWELNCIAASRSGLYFLNLPLVYYRLHDSQTVSIGNMRDRSRKEILSEKIKGAKGTVLCEQNMIRMLEKQESNPYMHSLMRLLDFRQRVLCGNMFFFPAEVVLFLGMIIKYGGKRENLDIRYLFIDFLSLFLKS